MQSALSLILHKSMLGMNGKWLTETGEIMIEKRRSRKSWETKDILSAWEMRVWRDCHLFTSGCDYNEKIGHAFSLVCAFTEGSSGVSELLYSFQTFNFSMRAAATLKKNTLFSNARAGVMTYRLFACIDGGILAFHGENEGRHVENRIHVRNLQTSSTTYKAEKVEFALIIRMQSIAYKCTLYNIWKNSREPNNNVNICGNSGRFIILENRAHALLCTRPFLNCFINSNSLRRNFLVREMNVQKRSDSRMKE